MVMDGDWYEERPTLNGGSGWALNPECYYLNLINSGLSTGGVLADFDVSSHVCSVVGSPSMASRGDVQFGATASRGADGWNAPAVALRGDGELEVSSEAIAKQEHLPTYKLTRTV